MLGHVAKKQRVDRVQDSHKDDGYLSGIKVSPQSYRYSLTSSNPAIETVQQAPTQLTALPRSIVVLWASPSVCCVLTGVSAEEHNLKRSGKGQYLVQEDYIGRRDRHSGMRH